MSKHQLELPVKGSGRVLVIKTITQREGYKGKEMNSREQEEFEVLLEGVLPENDLVAETSASVSLKTGGHEYYGKGTWDRIPYEVFVTCSFKVPCVPSVEKMMQANIIARELAQDRAKEAIGRSMAEHIMDIRTNLFRGLFNNA